MPRKISEEDSRKQMIDQQLGSRGLVFAGRDSLDEIAFREWFGLMPSVLDRAFKGEL